MIGPQEGGLAKYTSQVNWLTGGGGARAGFVAASVPSCPVPSSSPSRQGQAEGRLSKRDKSTSMAQTFGYFHVVEAGSQPAGALARIPREAKFPPTQPLA